MIGEIKRVKNKLFHNTNRICIGSLVPYMQQKACANGGNHENQE